MNVYPTGRQGAGVRDGDGRSGGSQWNQIEGLVHRSLAAKGRCLGKFGTGRRAHVGRTANMLLIPRMPRRMQPDSVCDVGDRHAEKQSRGDQDTGKQRRALGEACWAACECLRRTATGDGLRQDGGGGAGGAGGVAPARAPSCTQKFVCRKDSGEAVGGMTFVVGHAPAPAPATRPNAGGTSLPLQLCDFDLAGRRQPPSSCSLSLPPSSIFPHGEAVLLAHLFLSAYCSIRPSNRSSHRDIIRVPALRRSGHPFCLAFCCWAKKQHASSVHVVASKWVSSRVAPNDTKTACLVAWHLSHF